MRDFRTDLHHIRARSEPDQGQISARLEPDQGLLPGKWAMVESHDVYTSRSGIGVVDQVSMGKVPFGQRGFGSILCLCVASPCVLCAVCCTVLCAVLCCVLCAVCCTVCCTVLCAVLCSEIGRAHV